MFKENGESKGDYIIQWEAYMQSTNLLQQQYSDYSIDCCTAQVTPRENKTNIAAGAVGDSPCACFRTG